jgi:hypothetical protein
MHHPTRIHTIGKRPAVEARTRIYGAALDIATQHEVARLAAEQADWRAREAEAALLLGEDVDVSDLGSDAGGRS